MSALPRTIYFLWYQGLDQAPLVVRKCLESWKEHNPGWEILFLDQNNIGNRISVDLPARKLAHLNKAHQADLARLDLLDRYGGVWVDATTYCMRPLDDWLHPLMGSGFFCFHRPGRDRVMSNWFIAAEQGNPIVSKMKRALTKYWASHHFELGPRLKGRRGKAVTRYTKIWLGRNDRTATLWLSPFVTRFLRIYPYFAFHYLFAKLVHEDADCRRIWNEMEKVSADGPHRLYHRGLLTDVDVAIKDEIDRARCPLYKLTWKYDAAFYRQGCALHYLLEGRPRSTA